MLVRLGRPDEAVAAAEEMVELADELGDAELPSVARHDLGSCSARWASTPAAWTSWTRCWPKEAKLNVAGARLRRAESLVCTRAARARRLAELRATVLTPLRPADQPETLVPRLARVQALLARARGDDEEALRYFDEAAAGWRGLGGLDRRDAYMSNLVDLGRPPVAGLTEPARELKRVLSEREELHGMPSFDDTAVIDSPPEEVWKLLYDPARFPEWMRGVGSVTDVHARPAARSSRSTRRATRTSRCRSGSAPRAITAA